MWSADSEIGASPLEVYCAQELRSVWEDYDRVVDPRSTMPLDLEELELDVSADAVQDLFLSYFGDAETSHSPNRTKKEKEAQGWLSELNQGIGPINLALPSDAFDSDEDPVVITRVITRTLYVD